MTARRPYRLFEVVGLELEYPLVDGELEVVAGVEELFRRLHGRPTSSVSVDGVELSNELAAHVLEIKNVRPSASLASAERHLHRGLCRAMEVLEDELGLALLPTGMHPFMRPEEGELWQRAGALVYRTFADVFGIRRHGFLNVQSCHVNFPFGTEAQMPRLHNALACLMPYLPALTASSPFVEGRRGRSLDMRLEHYGPIQDRIPEITGDVVPGYMTTPAAYRREVLEPIYRKLDAIGGAERIRREFINSRGIIPKFYRDSLEVRVVDAQECLRMDAAFAAFLRGATRWLYRRLEAGGDELPLHDDLVADYRAVLRRGRAARVRAPHLGGPGTAREVLEGLLEPVAGQLRGDESGYLELVAARLRHGCLAEVIVGEVERRREAGGGRGSARDRGGEDRSPRKGPLRPALVAVYRELQEALRANRPWRLG